MAFTYTKLSTSITESSVWSEADHIRLVWITMLAMADKDGQVEASLPGLAARARVSLEGTEEAIKKFLSPDRYSRTPDREGRRIEVVPRGWRLINHGLYRKLLDTEDRREYLRLKKAEERAGQNGARKAQPGRQAARENRRTVRDEKLKSRMREGLYVPPRK